MNTGPRGSDPHRAIAANRPVPNYGIADDYPLLWERSKLHDDRERLGGDRDPLGAEVDGVLREVWMARSAMWTMVEEGVRDAGF